jgi:hypothetical protein
VTSRQGVTRTASVAAGLLGAIFIAVGLSGPPLHWLPLLFFLGLPLPPIVALAFLGVGAIMVAGAAAAGALSSRAIPPAPTVRRPSPPVPRPRASVERTQAAPIPTPEEAAEPSEVPIREGESLEVPTPEPPSAVPMPGATPTAAAPPVELPAPLNAVQPSAEGPLAFSPGMLAPADRAVSLGDLTQGPDLVAEETEREMEEEIVRLRERVRELETRPDATVPTSSPPPAPLSSQVGGPSLTRLSRVPSPPAFALRTSGAARQSCSGCGALLVDAARSHGCWGCGRPLCVDCYWRSAADRSVHYCPGCVGRGIPQTSRSGGATSTEQLRGSGGSSLGGRPPGSFLRY